MTASRPAKLHGLTIDEFLELPEDSNRYELDNGSLWVSPPPTVRHGRGNYRIDEILRRTCPRGLMVLSLGLGVDLNGKDTCYIPDTLVTTEEAFNNSGRLLLSDDVLLVVEVLSPSNRRFDLKKKPRGFGHAGIPSYWIVDDVNHALTVFTEPSAEGYGREEAIKAGERWTTSAPFPVTLDPADFT